MSCAEPPLVKVDAMLQKRVMAFRNRAIRAITGNRTGQFAQLIRRRVGAIKTNAELTFPKQKTNRAFICREVCTMQQRRVLRAQRTRFLASTQKYATVKALASPL
jgi:hypothetical protein